MLLISLALSHKSYDRFLNFLTIRISMAAARRITAASMPIRIFIQPSIPILTSPAYARLLTTVYKMSWQALRICRRRCGALCIRGKIGAYVEGGQAAGAGKVIGLHKAPEAIGTGHRAKVGTIY